MLTGLVMTVGFHQAMREATAKHVRTFQDIVRKGIDEQLLAWKGIEATETLSKSPNTKIIAVGNKQGLPLILGQ